MNEHPPAWPTIVALLSAALTLLLGWLHLSRNREIDALKKLAEEAHDDAESASDALYDHKLYAAENFARKADVKADIEAMEGRLNKRLDELKLLLLRRHDSAS